MTMTSQHTTSIEQGLIQGTIEFKGDYTANSATVINWVPSFAQDRAFSELTIILNHV